MKGLSIMRIDTQSIIIENDQMRMVVGSNGITESLICKASMEECLAVGEEIALFSVTQERPYNNEVKLAHPNKRTTFQANAIRRVGNKLIIGFEIKPYKAVVEVKETPWYIAFSLVDFIVQPEDYGSLCMTPPPAVEMRFLQLPVRNRTNFGEWLNVCWDDNNAVNVLATSPHPRIDSKRRKGYRIMCADAVKGIKLKGASAALIVSATDKLLDNIAQVEEDFGLPKGVASRRGEMINASYYWSGDITPDNVEEHIKYAKQGGFRMMQIYYTSIFKEEHGYGLKGNYDYRKEYPNGRDDLVSMLDKIHAAGIIPGLHFLHAHIGLWSRYVTPVPDHRLNLKMRFPLSRPLQKDDTVIYTDQNPEGAVMADRCRVLKIENELVSYTAYSTEPPYCFTGVERGAHGTAAISHPLGFMLGILDVSEFGGVSCHIDQTTGLQDEIAEKIADAYSAGFRFVYFDGSEAVNAPFEFHVPNAQYRVYKKLDPAPLLAEGAAKAHFSWHMLSGGNAFDIFPPEVFKEKIRQFPAEEAPRMKQDFTRLNFGWWGYWVPGTPLDPMIHISDETNDGLPPMTIGTQPDMLEYATGVAAAWDCPAVLFGKPEDFAKHPRTPDNLEVMRRWEDIRAKKWLTGEHKTALKNLEEEHILLINENKEYELVPYDFIPNAAGGNANIRAFVFERNGENYAVYWHISGSGQIKLPLDARDVIIMEELNEGSTPQDDGHGAIILPICKRRYVKTFLSKERLIEAFQQAILLE